MPKFTLYKYVKVEGQGWRYCRAVSSQNGKLRPNLILVDGREETHAEGFYVMDVNGQWVRAGEDSVHAQAEQRLRLARQRFEKDSGEKLPEKVVGTR